MDNKITLSPVTGANNLSVMNDNFSKVQAFINEKALSRKITNDEANQMEVDLDMNGHRIYNLPKPIMGNEPVRLVDLAGWGGGGGGDDPTLRADLAAPTGASLVGYGSSTVKAKLDNLDQRVVSLESGGGGGGDGVPTFETYALLRAYAGVSSIADVVGQNILGTFVVDPTSTALDNGGTVIVGADNRRWIRRMNRDVSVGWFGADRNNQGDSSGAFNRAIEFVNSRGGGTVYIPSGVYRIKNTIMWKAGVNLLGESMMNTSLMWWPDASAANQDIINTYNQNLSRCVFSDFRLTKHESATGNVTGIAGGSELVVYNSAIACFENIHFDMLTYGIRGNTAPTGVGIFDCYFKNLWFSGCFFGLWLFGSSNRVDHCRFTNNDTAVVLDYLNGESFDSMTMTGGTFVSNNYDIGIHHVSGIRPTQIIGAWFEQSQFGIINIKNPNTQVMNLDFIGCMFNTRYAGSLFNVANAIGTVSVDRTTLIATTPTESQVFIRPNVANSRLIVTACQRYTNTGLPAMVDDRNVLEVAKGGGDQAVAPTAYTHISFATMRVDTAGTWSAAENGYRVPCAGLYRVTAQLGFSQHSTNANLNQVLLYQNNVFRRQVTAPSSATQQTTVLGSWVIPCDAGDLLTIRAMHNNGGNINVLGANDMSQFSVEFVRHR